MDDEASSATRLLVLAQAGDRSALGALMELYRPYLSLLARLQIGGRLQSKVDAADLVQETFLAAYKNWAHFRGESEAELLTWLRRILAGRLADLLRRYLGGKRRDVHLERELAEEIDRSSQALDGALWTSQTPSKHLARREQGVLLANALNGLPEAYREVLILRHLEGLRFADVAQRMGRSLDGVKKLWTRALGQLRQSLKGAL